MAADGGQWGRCRTVFFFFFLVRRFPQLIIIRPVIRLSPIVATYDRYGSDGAVSTAVHHHLIRLILLIPIAPLRLIMETRGGGDARYLSSKQRHHGIHLVMVSLGSSSHPITVMKRLACRLVHRLVSRLMRLGRASRTNTRGINEGEDDDEASKRTRKSRDGGRDEKPGSKAGRKTKREQEASRRGNGDMRQSRTRTKRPLIISPDPLAVGSRRFAGLKQVPRPRAWDEKMKIS